MDAASGLDYHSFCCDWARCGQCDRNPVYMRTVCQRSCGTVGCRGTRLWPLVEDARGCSLEPGTKAQASWENHCFNTYFVTSGGTYLCVCRACAHMCMRVHSCTFVSMCVCVLVCACECECVHVRVHVCVCMPPCMCAYMHVYVWLCACLNVRMCMHVHFLFVHVCMSVCTYVCTHACVCVHAFLCACMAAYMYGSNIVGSLVFVSTHPRGNATTDQRSLAQGTRTTPEQPKKWQQSRLETSLQRFGEG